MPLFERGDLAIHYELSGPPDAPPLLLIAPGGMRSSIEIWSTRPEHDPRVHLAQRRIVAMDQRNAGESVASVSDDDGWAKYTDDQLALMDHLGIERFDVLGMCIGGTYITRLVRAAPSRIGRAVVFQPIGLRPGPDGNREVFFELFDAWAEGLGPNHPEATPETWASFKRNMFGSDDLLFGATEDDVRAFSTPLLLFMGDDVYHPAATSRRIAEIAPDVTFVEAWKNNPDETWARVKTFLE